MSGQSGRRDFADGFRAMTPLWLGVVPFGLAYAVLARDAGLSLLETQALSVLVFAGSAQFSAVGLFGAGAAGLEIVLTTLLLNVRHVLYGMALGRTMRLTARQRPVAAYFLTDEAFGVAAASHRRTFPFLLGTELSLFATWNLATFAGALLGAAIPNPAELGLDVVFPLAFIALLVPLVRTRIELVVALCSGATAYVIAAGPPRRPADPRDGRRRQPPGSVAHAPGAPAPCDRSRRCDQGGGMSFWLTTCGMVAVTFGSRFAGLALRAEPGPFWQRFLHFVPIAVFAALVTPPLAGGSGEGEIRLVAAVLAALAAWRTKQLWIALAVGMATFWLLRIPFGS